MSIYTKLFDIQKLHLAFSKDAKNPFFKSNYISLDSIVATLTPLLDERNLLVVHYTENKEVVTELIDTEETGFNIQSRFPLIDSNDPQKLGSCITYAKRYNLSQIFNIITDRDDDGNGASWVEDEVAEEETVVEPTEWFKDENLTKMSAWTYSSPDDAVKLARTKYKVSKQSANAIRHFVKTWEVKLINNFPKD